MNQSTAELFPGAGAGIVPAPVSVLRPDPSLLFERRAERLLALSQNHPMGGFLEFIGQLASIQSQLAGAVKTASWQSLLPPLLVEIVKLPLTEPVISSAVRLRAADLDKLEAIVARWLAGSPEPGDLAFLPFIVAAMQVERTLGAARQEPFEPEEHTGLCPVCGFHPVAGIIKTVGQSENVRYLQCGLCATEWHYERLRCAECGSDGSMVYQRLEGFPFPVEAESCRSCKVYMKIFTPGGDTDFDALADDLASTAFDAKLNDEGWRRVWPNPFLHGA